MITQIKPTVLVVDDSRTIRTLFTDLLSESGFDTMLARDGLEALEKLEQHRPDVVLLDIVMPRMNGYELCRKLRENPATRHIPIVMVSSKDQEFDRYWGLKQGADAYITRPCSPEEIVTTLRDLLNAKVEHADSA